MARVPPGPSDTSPFVKMSRKVKEVTLVAKSARGSGSEAKVQEIKRKARRKLSESQPLIIMRYAAMLLQDLSVTSIKYVKATCCSTCAPPFMGCEVH